MDMGPMGKYQFITHGNLLIGAIMPCPPQRPGPGWGFYFRVGSISAAIAAIPAHGGQILNGPHAVPGGDSVIQALDPEGVAFGLVGASGG